MTAVQANEAAIKASQGSGNFEKVMAHIELVANAGKFRIMQHPFCDRATANALVNLGYRVSYFDDKWSIEWGVEA